MGTEILLSAADWFRDFFKAFGEKFMEAIRIGDIGEQIGEAILPWKNIFQVGSVKLLLTDAIIVTWVAVIPFIILWVWIASKRQTIPTGRQLISETVVKLFLDLCKSNGLNSKQSEQVAPMIGSICFFLISCNLISAFKIAPPAKNVAFPIALALFTITYVIVMAIRFVGIKGLWSSMLYPMSAMLPFKILDFIIKPMSLALRLFGNVFGAFILMEFLYILIPAIVPGVFGLWFDIADGLIQAVIFSYLTVLYIGEIVENAEAAKELKHQKTTMAAS